MKKLSIILFVLSFTVCIVAQIPEKISYQAVIRNSVGELINGSAIGIRISILQSSATGNAVYIETHTPATNTNGLVTLEIGNGTPISGTFADIDWSTGIYYIKTETDPSGGTNYSIIGTSQILSVPYSLYAKKAESVDDIMNQLYDQGFLKPKDGDGNEYTVVKIGSQRWLKENLKTSKYTDGSSITNVTDGATWGGLTSPAYCWYNNDALTYKDLYGALYNWYAANTGKICPIGWHVSTDLDWKTLEMYLGMTQEQADASGWRGTNQGTQLKSSTEWLPGGADNGTNTVGFTALPGGDREGGSGAFAGLGSLGVWWVIPQYNLTDGWYRYLNNYNSTESNGIARIYQTKVVGSSIRCVRD